MGAEEHTADDLKDLKDLKDREDFDALAERLARWVVEKGLATPAVFLLEMHKPVAPLGSMMLLGAMPFLGPFVGFGGVEKLALFVEERSNVERLIKRIETLSREGDAVPPDAGDVAREEAKA